MVRASSQSKANLDQDKNVVKGFPSISDVIYCSNSLVFRKGPKSTGQNQKK